MKTSEFKQEIARKTQIAVLNLRIALVSAAMSFEEGITDEWKTLARHQGALIQRRNHLRTPAEIRKIEKRRGLS